MFTRIRRAGAMGLLRAESCSEDDGDELPLGAAAGAETGGEERKGTKRKAGLPLLLPLSSGVDIEQQSR